MEFLRFVAGLDLTAHRSVRDRLIERIESLAACIAHGNARRTFSDRRKWFEVARGRTMECAADLDVLRELQVLGPPQHTEGRRLAGRINTMLMGMIDPQHAATLEAFPLGESPAAESIEAEDIRLPEELN